MATIRVHNLAKELNVKSTAIVDKCQAEGLPIKNHMSTVSVGLEATIREWFSAGAHTTTVELTEKVDLEKVKVKKSRKRKPIKTDESPSEDTVESPEETDAHETEQPEVDSDEKVSPAEPSGSDGLDGPRAARPKRLSPKEIAEEHQEDLTEESAAAVQEEDSDASEETEQAPAAQAQEETPPEPRMAPGMMKPSAAPKEPVKPQEEFVPTPAVLQGPKVIRVERADTVHIPPRGPKRPAAPRSASLPVEPNVVPDSGVGKRPKKGKKSAGEADWEGEKKRTARGRRHGRGHDPAQVHQWGDRDLQERQERLALASGKKLHGRQRRMSEDGHPGGMAAPQAIESAKVKEPITVKDLSSAIGVRGNIIIGKLMGMGIMASINQVLDSDAASMVAMEFGIELVIEKKKLLLDELQNEFDSAEVDEDKLSPRPPVVAFLGHVDHGKTSLLDRIRKASVADGEAGGITQHIGSHLYDDGKNRVTFLDTPGHKAFTEMRARGANMTDILVLVVAADDGIMPQTEEAINHAKAAGAPIVVALNKIDLPNANVNRVLGQLAEHDLTPSEWGGTTEVVQTSAATGEGIQDLVEHLEYIAELNNLRARSEGAATGWIVESEMSIGQGVVARLLVKAGKLKTGDIIVSGKSQGRVRTLRDPLGNELEFAGPSMPVEISGLDEMPNAGDRFFILDDITKAVAIAEEQRVSRREEKLGKRRQITLENLFTEIAAGEVRELNMIIKADVQGSVDVLVNTAQELNTDEVAVRVLHAAVGGISESDIVLAEASNAIVVGFQVVADEHARQLAEQSGVEVRLYRVIYNLVDDVKLALEGMLKPRIEEKQLGRVEVRDTFKISRIGVIAGCYVTEGAIPRSAKVRLIRDNIVVNDELRIESLKREKNDASEVRSGLECGIKLARFDDIKVGDIIEAYEMIEITRKLD